MWIVAGVLLGAMLLGGLVGLHAGPHVHLAAVVAGVAAAAWLVLMALAGRSGVLLYLLLGADLAGTAGLAVGGWRALRSGAQHRHRHGPGQLEGREGVALSPLAPDGVVRVSGEDWSARSLNGPVAAGTRVQVIRADGVRLEVWSDEERVLS